MQLSDGIFYWHRSHDHAIIKWHLGLALVTSCASPWSQGLGIPWSSNCIFEWHLSCDPAIRKLHSWLASVRWCRSHETVSSTGLISCNHQKAYLNDFGYVISSVISKLHFWLALVKWRSYHQMVWNVYIWLTSAMSSIVIFNWPWRCDSATCKQHFRQTLVRWRGIR